MTQKSLEFSSQAMAAVVASPAPTFAFLPGSNPDSPNSTRQLDFRRLTDRISVEYSRWTLSLNNDRIQSRTDKTIVEPMEYPGAHKRLVKGGFEKVAEAAEAYKDMFETDRTLAHHCAIWFCDVEIT